LNKKLFIISSHPYYKKEGRERVRGRIYTLYPRKALQVNNKRKYRFISQKR
jgi:hypothetical protein